MDQAERLRNIVKQQNSINERQARVITVTSGKGGVGKSSISINLAIEFAKQGKKVIIFDADFGLANIEVMFGAIPKYNLADMIFNGKEFKDIIVNGPLDVGFVSGGSGINRLANMTKDQVLFLVYKLRELESLADVIIVDTGAGISDSVLEFVMMSNEVILVTTPEPTSITDSYALLKSLNSKSNFNKNDAQINVISNRVDDFEEGQNLYSKLNLVVEKFLNINLKFLGIIPNDSSMQKAVMQQKPVTIAYPNSAGAKAFGDITQVLLGQGEVVNNDKKGLAGAFIQMFKNVRKNKK